MKIQHIYVGSWFQRTTLHLSEIYDFFKEADSPLDLDKKKLVQLRDALGLTSTEIRLDNLEHIQATAKNGISFKVYEDGLIILGNDSTGDTKKDIAELTAYYEKKLSAGLKYIFSLGAPLPKELANIKTVYPYFLVLDKGDKKDIAQLLDDFGQKKYFEIRKDSFEIYRGDKLYIINNRGEALETIELFIQEQVFLREFKGQLHRYLNLHRIIWERIADVKEKGEIAGKDIGGFKATIEGYSKSINFIEARINQMGTYVRTRESVIKKNKNLEKFADVLQFKYETLVDTLSYVKEIWRMTKNYVHRALDLFSDLQAKATNHSIKSLTVVTSMGVGATLIGLFTQKKIPDFTWFGVLYFVILAVIGFSANKIMNTIYSRKSYKIKDIKADKDIK